MSLSSWLKGIVKASTGHEKGFVSAVIVAAGSGSRMGGNTPKQFLPLCGMPVIARTIFAFEDAEDVDEIIIVAREEDMSYYKRLIDSYGYTKIKAVVKGGKTRQESVFCALSKLDKKCRFILIHDGARPLVTGKNISDTLDAARKYNCACAASRAKDTVKISNASGYIEHTPERAHTWNAQTPQIFRAEIYRAAAFTAKKQGFEGTDDCSLVEKIGFKIKLVDCGYENIKITTPEDLKTAENILDMRGVNG